MSKKITELTATTILSSDDLLPIVVNNSSVPETRKVSISNLIPSLNVNGRLTLTSGNPTPTADQTAKTILYFTPYMGNYIALYDGVGWASKQFSEVSISLTGLSADTNYDVFGFYSSGLELSLVAWTSATVRATALALQDGVYVKSDDASKRYLGTIRTTATIGQCEDSKQRRLVWNYYNRVQKYGYLYTGSGSAHTYASTTVRAYNNDATWFIESVKGLVEEFMYVGLTSDTYTNANLGFGYDDPLTQVGNILNFATSRIRLYGRFVVASETIGYHKIYLNEASVSGTANFQSATITSEIMG